jgi:hemoglobin-like flavoprotein
MGTGTSSSRGAKVDISSGDVIALQEQLARQTSIPLALQVAHYTPSFFPLLPIISPLTCKKITDAWDIIVNKEHVDGLGNKTSGITLFYNEFYEHLDKVDTSGKFEAVLARHVSGANQVAAKGAIIVRIVKFICNITEDGPETQQKLYMLGKMHNHIGIRPWQYSVFVQVLLMTISNRLGTAATNDVMEAWVNMFAFVLRSMLPPAIKGQVVETELSVNTSSEFQDSRVAAEIAEVEETVNLRRKFGGSVGSRSQASSGRSASERGDQSVTLLTMRHDVH